MSVLYLVRHGQAGTRENYDSLSELGRTQARLLGKHLRGTQFSAAYSGSLARQQATAAETLPEAKIIVDAGWDEFDLSQVYRELSPHLSRDDEQFRIEFEEMQRDIAASRGSHDAPVHRKWNDCDKKCVRAWVEGKYEYSGETWRVVRRTDSRGDDAGDWRGAWRQRRRVHVSDADRDRSGQDFGDRRWSRDVAGGSDV